MALLVLSHLGHAAEVPGDGQVYEKLRDAQAKGARVSPAQKDKLTREHLAPGFWQRARKIDPPANHQVPKTKPQGEELELTQKELEALGVTGGDSEGSKGGSDQPRPRAEQRRSPAPPPPKEPEVTPVDGSGVPRTLSFPGKKRPPQKQPR